MRVIPSGANRSGTPDRSCRITSSAKTSASPNRAYSRSARSESVSVATVSGAGPALSRAHCSSRVPSPSPRRAGCTMPVVVAPESPRYSEAAATRAPEASRAAIDSPISIRPRSICSPANSGDPPSASKEAWARMHSSSKELSSSALQVRSLVTDSPPSSMGRVLRLLSIHAAGCANSLW